MALKKPFLFRSEILVLNIELEKVIFSVAVRSITSNITRIFIVANDLQPVRKILKRLCKSALLNIF